MYKFIFILFSYISFKIFNNYYFNLFLKYRFYFIVFFFYIFLPCIYFLIPYSDIAFYTLFVPMYYLTDTAWIDLLIVLALFT